MDDIHMIDIPKEIQSKVTELTDMLNKPGADCDFGWYKPVLEAINLVKSITDKPCCFVEDWCWWDIEVPKTAKDQHSLCVIYARNVIHDDAGRFDNGDYVRTSPLVTFHKPAFFETSRTVYILVGKGTRKTISLENLAAVG